MGFFAAVASLLGSSLGRLTAGVSAFFFWVGLGLKKAWSVADFFWGSSLAMAASLWL